MPDVYLAGARRTPSGAFQGALSDVPATDLGARVTEATIDASGLQPDDVDEVVMGNVIAAGLGQNPARQAAIQAGVPVERGAFTVNKVCGSSLKAAMLASQSIEVGDRDVVVAGGFENMTRAPHLVRNGRAYQRLGSFVVDGDQLDGETVEDAMQEDGLRDAYEGIMMGDTGDIVAERRGVTREAADAFAVRSHERAARAWDDGDFDTEVVAVDTPDGIVDEDETIRRDTSAEALADLDPYFNEDGVVTPGNASQIADGAAATVVASGDAVDDRGLDPLARVVDYAVAGVEPKHVMEAPIPGVQKLLDDNDLTVDDLDVVDHNEAFATASCAVRAALKIPDERFNVRGGAVALGHPLGASGARVLTTMVHALVDRGGRYGVATLCLGGGNSVQMLVEAV